MAGTHGEIIETLETRFDQLELGLTEVGDRVSIIDRTIGRMERAMNRRFQRSSSKSNSSSSSSHSVGSEVSSKGEENPTRPREQDDRNRCENREHDDRRKGKPKLFCPTFDGTDPISWLSRVNQFFDLSEIERKDRVRSILP